MLFNPDIHAGNFSSSEIVRLFGKRGGRETYIREKRMERKLGRVLKSDFSSEPTAWGHLMEWWVLQKKLGIEYRLVSQETVKHPTVDCWVGSPDYTKEVEGIKVVGDVKGLQLKAFCEMVDAWERGKILEVRSETESGEKFYWQIVSNGCITGAKIGELTLYCPFKSELDAIRHAVNNEDIPGAERFKRFAWKSDDELPYLPDGCGYNNLYTFQFPLPAKDRAFLHDEVVRAAKELIPQPVTA